MTRIEESKMDGSKSNTVVTEYLTPFEMRRSVSQLSSAYEDAVEEF